MVLIKNGRIHTITSGIIKNGDILIKNGIIKEVGNNLSAPEGAETISAEGKTVTPGFIDAHAHTGVFNEGVGYEKADDGNECTDPVTPECRAVDAINFLDPAFDYALSGGVTTIMTGPGSGNIIGGQSAVVKTHGDTLEEMLVKSFAGMKMALGENPIRVYSEKNKMPTTRMGNAAILRKTLTDVENYISKKNKHLENNSDTEETFEKDVGMEALIPVIQGEVPARIHSHRADDILTAIRIGQEFNLDFCIEHCTEGYKVAEELAKHDVPVVLGPHMVTPLKWEMKDQTLKNAIKLSKAGVPVAIQTDDMRLVQYLALNAGLIIREGWSEEKALKSITVIPAKILGLEDRMGSIEEGKEADIAIFDGSPFDSRTVTEKVLIGGKEVYPCS